MRNRTLHQRLREFAEEAAFELCADAEVADEIPFEVVASPGARTPLYCYRPLTGEFIRERADRIERLPSHRGAAAALAGLAGVDDYLRLRGEGPVPADAGALADAALQAFLAALYDDRTDFTFCSERFARVYEELESAVYERRALSAVIAPIHGLALVSEEVPLDDDLSLVRGDRLGGAPAEAVWLGPRHGEEPNVLALLTVEDAGDSEEVLALARARFGRLLAALRLADAGAFALGPVGWARADAGAWQLVAVGTGMGADPSREPYRVAAEEEDELRGFCNLIGRRIDAQGRGELEWALGRFQAGAERGDRLMALTDHLLALRALLEPEGPGSGRLAQRLATICAVAAEQPALAERIAHAISLERAVVAGLPPAAPDADELIEDVAHHLRSLLRDVLCGHLDRDLVKLADDLLADAITGESNALPAPAAVAAGAPA